MIESVYSNDNADESRREMVTTDFRMPKNIRQIGKSSSPKKIYVEDYVMTFMRQLPGEDYGACRVAVLIGQYVKATQGGCIFISGAVEVEGIDITNGIVFTNDHWTAIYDNIKKFFVEVEIVGWFIGGPGYLLEDKEKILKAHIDNFAGQDKTLVTFDNMEKEESFYIYENGSLKEQEGFYIYYEKNEEMQNYMIESKEKPSEEENYDDRVSRDIRTLLQNKKSTYENKNSNHLIYAAGTLLAVIIMVVGAVMLSNYDQMKNMQNTLNTLTDNFKQVESVFLRNENQKAITNMDDQMPDIAKETSINDTKDSEDSEKSLNVEVVPGGVTPLVKNDNEGENSYEEQANTESMAQNPDISVNNEEEDEDHETLGEQDAETNAPVEVKYYTVKAGDSLAGISYRLYSSANYISIIKNLNNIEDEDMIYIGQKLILP